jgi:hypothetical protein
MGMEMEDCCVEKEGHLEKILEDVHRRIEKLGMGKIVLCGWMWKWE